MARSAPNRAIRVATRLAIGFALDVAKLAGSGRGLFDGMLLTAITQANVAQVMRSPKLQWAYATLDSTLPDELRRPVSVSAIANSLRMPFETTRRRIAALTAAGLVVREPRGVVVPSGPLGSPEFRAIAVAHYGLIRNLYLRLRAVGFLADLPEARSPGFDRDNPPMRLIVRLSSEYMLRTAEPFNTHIGDLVTGLVLMEVIQANTEHWPDRAASVEDDGTPGDFAPDSRRRPVRVAVLSQRLGIPQETVRRRLTRLIREDRCERVEDGYIVPARILAAGPFVQFVVDNESHLKRLFTQLADFGVLSEWESEAGTLLGAASA